MKQLYRAQNKKAKLWDNLRVLSVEATPRRHPQMPGAEWKIQELVFLSEA